MKPRKRTLLQSGFLTCVAHHSVLADVARDLVRAAADWRPSDRPVVLHVGAHLSSRLPDAEGAIQVGLQTEQILDADGRPMWFNFDTDRLGTMVRSFDILLDLSPHNAPAYDALAPQDRARLRFGPHIFPGSPPPARDPGARLLFVGAMNDRRRTALRQLGPRVEVLPDGTFGDAAEAALIAAEGMLNLHFAEGTYTEYPRLLKAVLAGRALWSEPLAAPFVEGVHYFSPGANPEPGEVARVQQAMAQLVCASFSLPRFLASLPG